MTARVRQPVALALAAALLLPVAGCGGNDKKGDPIPRAQAALIVARLQEAKRRNSPFRCDDLKQDTVPALRDEVESLPENVDADVRQTLSDGVNHLDDLVTQACNERQTTTETTPTETTTESTPSTTESTPSTETTNTDTNKDTNTNTNTDTNTTPSNTGPSGGTPSPGGATSGGDGNGKGNGGGTG